MALDHRRLTPGSEQDECPRIGDDRCLGGGRELDDVNRRKELGAAGRRWAERQTWDAVNSVVRTEYLRLARACQVYGLGFA